MMSLGGGNLTSLGFNMPRGPVCSGGVRAPVLHSGASKVEFIFPNTFANTGGSQVLAVAGRPGERSENLFPTGLCVLLGLSLETQIVGGGERLENQRMPRRLCPPGRGCWPHAGPQEAEVRGCSGRRAGPFREEESPSLSEPANPSETSLARRHQRPSRPAPSAAGAQPSGKDTRRAL